MSKMFRITKTIEFDYGHRIPDHKSKCFNVHGHRARVKATVEGPLHVFGSSTGMVQDFSELKEAMMDEIHQRFDHCFLAVTEDPLFKTLVESSTESSGANTVPQAGVAMRYKIQDFGIIQELSV